MPQENRRCGDCRFAEKVDGYESQKRCRRSAPSNGSDVGRWPRVLLTDWCFQFESARSSGAQSPTSQRSVTEAAGKGAAASWDTVIAELNSKNHQSTSAGTVK